MSIIQRLSPRLANQIAAGEVIERPASVVKELLENSLDAQAEHILIELEKGGTKLIRIRDDGLGMSKKDLPLSVSRHATSKIASLDDLHNIASLGFRGEALASISSVSRFSLLSGQNDQAWRLTVFGSEMASQLEPAAHPQGTTVEVRDLFYNTPARRKFLRTANTEWNHIETTLYQIALSSFEVAFTVKHQDKLIFQLPKAQEELAKERRVKKICGQGFLNSSLYIDVSATGLQLNGWLGLPTFSRSQSDCQYLYVNGRIVRDRLLNHAIRQAYADKLPQGRYPGYVLYLSCSPQSVDINVHPTKHEVRFSDPRLVHDFVVKSLQEILQRGEQQGMIEKDIALPASAPDYPLPPQTSAESLCYPPQRYGNKPASSVREQLSAYAALHQQPIAPKENTLKAIGRFASRYYLAEKDSGLLIIDLIALQALLISHELRTGLAAHTLNSTPLLLPITFELDKQTLLRFMKSRSVFAQLGIEIEEMGMTTLVVRQALSLMNSVTVEAVINTFKEVNEITVEPLIDTIAQQVAINKTPHLSESAIQDNLDKLGQLKSKSPELLAKSKLCVIFTEDELVKELLSRPYSFI